MNVNFETLRIEDNSIDMERETGLTQSAFKRELSFFNSIKNGDVDSVKKKAGEYLKEGVIMGNMSSNSVRQFKYWAVATVSVATHYAILGGMDETDAFNLSDEYIRHIDSTNSMEELLPYLLDKATDLAYGVYNAKANLAFSAAVRRCLHYIHVHLHEKITVEDLCGECNLTRGYLSKLFKEELHLTIHEYITREKIKAATIMLGDGISLSEISYKLSFCSESHFIKTYKRLTGKTPVKALNYQSEPQSVEPESQLESELQS